MSKRIYKYPLNGAGLTDLPVHKTSEVVLVGEQEGVTYVWIADNTDPHEEKRQFIILGTGWVIDNGLVHIGSHQAADGLVWHIYEILS